MDSAKIYIISAKGEFRSLCGYNAHHENTNPQASLTAPETKVAAVITK